MRWPTAAHHNRFGSSGAERRRHLIDGQPGKTSATGRVFRANELANGMTITYVVIVTTKTLPAREPSTTPTHGTGTQIVYKMTQDDDDNDDNGDEEDDDDGIASL